MKLSTLEIAKIAHEVNRSYCQAIGDFSQVSWDEAPAWQRSSAEAGVRSIMFDPDLSPGASHESWLAHKIADGWVYGAEKDPEGKKHPCILPFEELEKDQQVKDYLFVGIVKTLLDVDHE